MKIVIIGAAYPYRGGIAHSTALLYQALEKNFHQVLLFSFSRQYPTLFFPGKTQFESSKPLIPINVELILDSISPFSWFYVTKRIREINPDLIIFRYWMPFFAPAYACISRLVKLGRKTKILYICDNIIPHEPRYGDNFLTKIALSAVDYFLVMSRSVEQDLLSFKSDARHALVEHPVYIIFGDKLSKSEARKKIQIETTDPIILFFGYIRKYKGLHLLLEAFPQILKKINVKLLIAGEFYDEKTNYLKQIENINSKDCIILKDNFIPDNEVGLYFSAADIVALPYISATQSGIVQIAYNYDRPVVATPVGGLPEVILQDKTGYVVSDISANSFAEGIVHMIKLKNEIDFEANIHEYKKRFSWDHMVETIENLVDDSF